jgi:RNA-directed DNA polymerase
MDVKR